MSSETINIIDQLSREKGIDKNVLIEALESAVEAAARKRLPEVKNIKSEFDPESGEIGIFVEKTIVENVEDPQTEISLEGASEFASDPEIGESVLIPQTLENYGRIAAQLAKQVILQKVREAEIENVYNEFIEKKGELVNGMFHCYEYGDIIVDLGKTEGILPRREQVFRETFNRGDRIRAYILDVRKTSKSALVILSRTHVGLIKRLFEMEVPEIGEGMVEIMGVVREPNGRTKIAVRSNDRDIDAVGACVGMRGMRVQSIVQELRGEKIDIVEYSEDSEVYARNALSPAKVSRLIMDHKQKQMTTIVADDQMSMAIGKKGQNVKLAARLIQWKIDIKGETEIRESLMQGHLLLKPKLLKKGFAEAIGEAEELGEAVAAALVERGVDSFDKVIQEGAEGLRQIPGIEEESAEKILTLAQSRLEEESAAAEPVELQEEDQDAETKTEETAPTQEDSVEAEPQEFPLEELANVDGKTIELLAKSGFQTLAELSITPLEELLAIEGIEESEAKTILEQAKLHTEKLENA